MYDYMTDEQKETFKKVFDECIIDDDILNMVFKYVLDEVENQAACLIVNKGVAYDKAIVRAVSELHDRYISKGDFHKKLKDHVKENREYFANMRRG